MQKQTIPTQEDLIELRKSADAKGEKMLKTADELFTAADKASSPALRESFLRKADDLQVAALREIARTRGINFPPGADARELTDLILPRLKMEKLAPQTLEAGFFPKRESGNSVLKSVAEPKADDFIGIAQLRSICTQRGIAFPPGATAVQLIELIAPTQTTLRGSKRA